jgi:hypothetical protein
MSLRKNIHKFVKKREMFKGKLTYWFIFTLVIFSCIRRTERPSWTVDVLAPIAKAKLSLDNLLVDSLKEIDQDKRITIVYNQKIADIRVDTLLPLNGQSYIKTVLLKDFELNSSSVTYKITLGEVLRNISFSDPGLQSFVNLILLFGTFTTPIPEPGIRNLWAGPVLLNADKVFRAADVISGFLEIEVTNENAFALENINYELRNKNDNALIGNSFIHRLSPGEKKIEIINLAGKRIEGFLNLFLNNLDIPSTQQSVTFDVNKGIKVVITARNLKVNYAEAVFPKQDVLNDTIETKLDNIGEFKLKSAGAKSGFVKVKVESTAPDTIYFTYKLWDAKVNGDTFKVARQKVFPAPEGQTISQTFIYKIENFFINLSGPTGDSVNYFRSQIIASFDSTGRLVKIDGNDSLRVEIKVYDVVPESAMGYFGQQSFKIGPQTKSFSVFKRVKGGNVDFKDANLDLKILNGTGVPAELNINSVEFINSLVNQTEKLQITSHSYRLNPAVFEPFEPKENNFSFNSQNSNINSVLRVLPDKVNYEALISTNPDGNNNLFDNFFKANSSIQAFLSIKVPLNVVINDLKLIETVIFKGDTINFPENINETTLVLKLKNDYPLNLNLKITFLDQANQSIDSLFTYTYVKAAEVDNSTYRTLKPEVAEYYFTLNKHRMKKILVNTRKIMFTVIFNTPNDNRYYTLFSDYEIDVKLMGDINFKAKFRGN